MDENNKTIKKLRAGYLNLLIFTLNKNINETLKHVNVDESVIQHYGLTIEEDCFVKNRSDLAPYTKAITTARLNIERYTEKQQPYPMIANALQLNESEQLPHVTHAASDESKRPENDPIKQKPNSELADEVIVIDSSDSEDELDAMITEDMKARKANNNNSLGEILVSVQTKSTKTDAP